MIAEEGLDDLREQLAKAYHTATELQDLVDQGVDVCWSEHETAPRDLVFPDFAQIRVELWKIIQQVGAGKLVLT